MKSNIRFTFDSHSIRVRFLFDSGSIPVQFDLKTFDSCLRYKTNLGWPCWKSIVEYTATLVFASLESPIKFTNIQMLAEFFETPLFQKKNRPKRLGSPNECRDWDHLHIPTIFMHFPFFTLDNSWFSCFKMTKIDCFF